MIRNEFKIEVCANGVESCLAAQEGEADRVELCAGIPEGGTTPSYGEIKVARRVLTRTRLHVIIRPRGGDFVYSPLEIERMEEDIDIARELGVDGIVLGCLTPEGGIDLDVNARLMEHTHGMSTTFHRAFDCCKDLRQPWSNSLSWASTVFSLPVSSPRPSKAYLCSRHFIFSRRPYHAARRLWCKRRQYPEHLRSHRYTRISFLGTR